MYVIIQLKYLLCLLYFDNLAVDCLFFHCFISIFTLLTCRKAMEVLIHRVSNYRDLLPEKFVSGSRLGQNIAVCLI